MARPAGATVALADFGNHHLGLIGEPFRVDLFNARGKDQSIARCRQLFLVFNQGSRVGVQVFIGSELHRVHENTGDDDIGGLGRLAHQRDMALVQVAHGGYQADGLTLLAIAPQNRAQFFE